MDGFSYPLPVAPKDTGWTPQGGSVYSWPADLSCVAVTGTPAMCATTRIRDLERGLKPVKLFGKGQSAAARDTSTLLPSHTAVHPAPTLLRRFL
jgi:hypothetical protein